MQKIHFHSFETIFDEKCHNLAVLIIVTFHSGAFTIKFVWFVKIRLSCREKKLFRNKKKSASALF